jgi:molybdopterin-binding protein
LPNLKLSTRNLLKGRVTGVEEGIIMAKVKISIETPAVITAVITKEAVDELNIKQGDNVLAMIKATSVSVAKEE